MITWIIVDADVDDHGQLVSSADELSKSVEALRWAIGGSITSNPSSPSPDDVLSDSDHSSVRLVSVHNLALSERTCSSSGCVNIICPLTLNLPETLQFDRQPIYSACRAVQALREQVHDQLGYRVGPGHFWLPVVLTTRGPLYGEVIGYRNPLLVPFSQTHLPSQSGALQFAQPFHLSDQWRQPLYQLGYRLLSKLSAPPATYLVQFGFEDHQHVCFDRLWPFPAPPALASVGKQCPNLFACHWACLTHQPIRDLKISATDEFWMCGS